jgi:putative lipoprotein (rSAM/lipoprotein system)
MREFFIKYFGRIFAMFGCSTIVTACYGVAYDPYDTPFDIKGRVMDAETDQPIKDIKVRVREVNQSSNLKPFDFSTSTASDGSFDMGGTSDALPSMYIIECTDIDGTLNGSYESVTEEVPYEQSHGIVIKMNPKRQ